MACARDALCDFPRTSAVFPCFWFSSRGCDIAVVLCSVSVFCAGAGDNVKELIETVLENVFLYGYCIQSNTEYSIQFRRSSYYIIVLVIPLNSWERSTNTVSPSLHVGSCPIFSLQSHLYRLLAIDSRFEASGLINSNCYRTLFTTCIGVVSRMHIVCRARQSVKFGCRLWLAKQ